MIIIQKETDVGNTQESSRGRERVGRWNNMNLNKDMWQYLS